MIHMSHLFSSELLKELNIIDCGYTEDPVATSYPNFKRWILEGKNADLKYLENEKMLIREDLRHYFPEFKSAFVFLFSYANEKKGLEDFYLTDKSNGLKIGSYCLIDGGRDYHYSIREKLDVLSKKLKLTNKNVKTLYSLDTQPILERDLALRAGLGWFGKNSMLINKKHGSFFLLGAILCDDVFKVESKIIESDFIIG